MDPADALMLFADDANDLVHDVVRDVGVEAQRRPHRDGRHLPVDDPDAPAGKVAGVQPRRSSATMRLSGNASGRSGRSVLAASIDGDGIPMNCHNAFTVPARYSASCSS
jgi:hypothetical protein